MLFAYGQVATWIFDDALKFNIGQDLKIIFCKEDRYALSIKYQ